MGPPGAPAKFALTLNLSSRLALGILFAKQSRANSSAKRSRSASANAALVQLARTKISLTTPKESVRTLSHALQDKNSTDTAQRRQASAKVAHQDRRRLKLEPMIRNVKKLRVRKVNTLVQTSVNRVRMGNTRQATATTTAYAWNTLYVVQDLNVLRHQNLRMTHARHVQLASLKIVMGAGTQDALRTRRAQ